MGAREPARRARDVLAFWFGQARDDDAYYEERRAMWFTPDAALDAQIAARFGADYALAARRRLRACRSTPRGALALIVLLDQFPRNMFRGCERAFATDGTALGVARALVAGGGHERLSPVERSVAYLPFMHSEAIADQRRAVALYGKLAEAGPYVAQALSFARRHLAVIERFGRFPGRNAALGRASTPEELRFLESGAAPF